MDLKVEECTKLVYVVTGVYRTKKGFTVHSKVFSTWKSASGFAESVQKSDVIPISIRISKCFINS